MLKNEASGSALVGEIDSLVSGLGLKTVEATVGTYQGSASMTVILYKSGEEINTDDLAAAYNLIYPRYSIILGDRDLQLEVSSPGLQRNIKDTMEYVEKNGKTEMRSTCWQRLLMKCSMSWNRYLTERSSSRQMSPMSCGLRSA